MTHRNLNIVIVSALLMVLMTISYALIDRPLSLFCQDLNPEVIQVFQWITKLGQSTGYLVGFAVLFVFFKYFRRRPIAAHRALFLFTAVALSGVIINLIKPLVGRMRPKLLFEANLYGFDPFRIGYEYNSFPSGHATTVFALATALALFFPRWRLPLVGFAVVVGVSRIVVGAHYLSDVMAGAYVGLMTVFLLVLLCRRRG
ncbi:MAG: phosphatase PAP2 family protein [Deltaproteobacteria bacterium HGW-Deltaproteobacteria-9]|nr:MAG: phosphatase PAP2 family protein [Deltaproteobacteria bacterium HGW-Deltaproteobacteria-9]